MKPLADGFIRLVKMLISPIIFCTVVTGIAGGGDMRRVGRTAGLALLYFELVSTLALLIGLIIVNVLRPGAAMRDVSQLDTAALASYTAAHTERSTADFILDIIPNTLVEAFAHGDNLQVLLCRSCSASPCNVWGSGGALRRDPERSEVLFSIIGIVMRLAPIGAFGAIAFTTGKYGITTPCFRWAS